MSRIHALLVLSMISCSGFCDECDAPAHDGTGRVAVNPFKGMLWGNGPAGHIAGEYVTYEVFYSPAMGGIAQGSEVKICQSIQDLPFEARLKAPQVGNPHAPGYISATRSDGGGVKLAITCRRPPDANDLRVQVGALELTATILDKPLKYSECLKITFGDTSRGAPAGFPYPAFTYPGIDHLIWAFAEYMIDGHKKFCRTQDPIRLPIMPGKVHRFLMNSESQGQVGKEIRFEIVPVDKFRNPAVFKGKINYKFTINGSEVLDGDTIDVDVRPYEKQVCTYIPKREGILRILAEANGIASTGFPIKVTADGPIINRYWGDVHVHTLHSDGYGSAENALSYARDILGHQFISLADHENGLARIDAISGKGMWPLYLEAAKQFNNPGSFTVMLAYEFSGKIPAHDGHHNIYTGQNSLTPANWKGDFNTIHELLEIVKKDKAMAISHCVIAKDSHGTDWRFNDPEAIRLVEIYSGWGCGEKGDTPRPVITLTGEYGGEKVRRASRVQESRSVISGLDKGFKVGFVAGSDEHSGRASNVTYYQGKKAGSRSLIWPSGTTCIMAKENTRTGLYEGLYERNCYAVSGEDRMLIDFSVNGFGMGQVVKEPQQKRQIKFAVSAVGEIVTITVIKNGKDLASFQPKSLDYQGVIVDEAQGDSEDYYYLRVLTNADDQGWSSPVWVH